MQTLFLEFLATDKEVYKLVQDTAKWVSIRKYPFDSLKSSMVTFKGKQLHDVNTVNELWEDFKKEVNTVTEVLKNDHIAKQAWDDVAKAVWESGYSGDNIATYDDIAEAVWECGCEVDDYMEDDGFDMHEFLKQHDGVLIEHTDNKVVIGWN